MFLSRKLPE
uniref:Uncharacterized protein n=1 Tax=Anguilla anguilla TaxID=7936 RepID=A0A0E9Q813_ANGAN